MSKKLPLVIRNQQFDALRSGSRQQFEQSLAQHLRATLPRQCRDLSDPQLVELTRLGVERAASWGFDERREVSLFLNLMLVVGRDFDRDPATPWAREILADELAILPPLIQMDRLYSRALEELERIEASA